MLKNLIDYDQELAAQWDYEKNGNMRPEQLTAGSTKKVWWKCDLGHRWQTAIANRYLHGTECPYCKNRKILIGFNDLSTTKPQIAAEWDCERNGDLRPEQYYKNS